MSQLSTFYSPITAADLGLGNTANVTFGSVTTGAVTASGPLSGTGFTNLLAAPPAIGNTTPNTGAFTTLSANNGTLTASAPVLDLAQTWDDSGTTFVGALINITATANSTSSNYFEIQRSGATQFAVVASGAFTPMLELGSGGFRTRIRGRTSGGVGVNFQNAVGIGDSLQFGVGSGTGAGDLILLRDDAATLALRSSTNPQTFRLYNTSTDASNYERGFMRWSSNVLQIGTEAAGTGSARALELQTGGVTRFSITAGGSAVAAAGITANSLVSSTTIRLGATSTLDYGLSRSKISSAADSQLLLQNNAQTDFSLLQFGGTTTSFPALKRSTTSLQVRLANDTAFAPFECAGLTLNGDLTASTRNIVTDTTTGTKIGTATTQKLGFFNATPVVQQAAIADATDAATTQDRLNDLLATMRTLGLIAT